MTLAFVHVKIIIKYDTDIFGKTSYIAKRMIIEINVIKRRYNINLINVTNILIITKKQIDRLI